jgi:anti-repressor protein
MYELTTTKQTMTSREIAGYTGKLHKHVLDAIRNMEPAWIKVTGTEFRLSEYTDPTGRKLPQYELSKLECLFISTKFNDITRAKLIKRWEELEKKTFLDFSNPATVLQLAQNWHDEMIRRQQAETTAQLQAAKLEKAAPKVDFYDKVVESSDLVDIGQVTKLLKLPFGRNKLFRRLREAGVFFLNRNEPMQQYVEAGYFQMKMKTIPRKNHRPINVMVTFATPKGMAYIHKRFGGNATQQKIKFA